MDGSNRDNKPKAIALDNEGYGTSICEHYYGQNTRTTRLVHTSNYPYFTYKSSHIYEEWSIHRGEKGTQSNSGKGNLGAKGNKLTR
ncbi:hypothetical protein JHK86_045131 [Glycine max]|nr:hypothetical protein JHK86_045131 [Glycine max]